MKVCTQEIIFSFLIVLCVAAMFPALTSASGTITVSPSSDDAFVYPDSGAVAANLIVVQAPASDANEIIGYVRFDLPAEVMGKTILTATLRLYLIQNHGTDNVVSLYRVNNPWSSSTMTWNTRPSRETTASASLILLNGDPANTGSIHSYCSWDVTSDVQSFALGEQNDYGWCIKDSSQSATFSSRLETANHPELVIVYGESFVVPEYYFGGFLALVACFAAFVIFRKRSSFPIFKRL